MPKVRAFKCRLCEQPLAVYEQREGYCDRCLRSRQWMPGAQTRTGLLKAAANADLNPIGEEAFKQLGRVRKP